RIDSVYQSANGALPDRFELKQLSDEFSVDFAALYLADQIDRIPINRRFRRAFDQAYEYARKAFPEGRVSLSKDYEVLVVPTYLYKRFFSVGADMAAPRAALKKAGLPYYFVETQDDGAVEGEGGGGARSIPPPRQGRRPLVSPRREKAGPGGGAAAHKPGARRAPPCCLMDQCHGGASGYSVG